MWLLAVAAVVFAAVMVVVCFPGSTMAVAVGWSIYLVIGLVLQPWGMAALALGAAIAAIWWDPHPPRLRWGVASVWRKTHKLLILQGVSRISSGEDRPDVVFFGVVSQESAHFGSIFATLTS